MIIVLWFDFTGPATSGCLCGGTWLRTKYQHTVYIVLLWFCPPHSTQQLRGDWVGRVGPLQRHLWAGNEETRAHGEDAAYRRVHVQDWGGWGGEMHDAGMPWVIKYSFPFISVVLRFYHSYIISLLLSTSVQISSLWWGGKQMSLVWIRLDK